MDQQTNVSNQVYDGFATVLRVFVLLTIVVGVVLLVRIIYLFFGTLQTAPGYDSVISLTDPLVAPLNMLEPIDTPYDGIFDVAGTGVLLGVMIVEFIISGIRSSLAKKSEKAMIQSIAAKARAAESSAGDETEEPALKK